MSGRFDDVRAVLDDRMDTHRQDLEALVRLPSVSAAGFDPGQVRRCAEAVRELLAARGLDNAVLLEVVGTHPAVYADWLHAGPDAPTVLLYAHYDVQPIGDPAAWSSPAFTPTEREGRLFGRGAADDKAGILAHVAAVDAWLRARGALPVNLKVIIEGEEEIGSEHLMQFLDAHGELLRADVVVVTDLENWAVGTPSITYLLRGLIDAVVQVRALDHTLHSGMYGGPVPDALHALVKLLARLTDERGDVAIPGFADDVRPLSPAERARLDALDFDEAHFRADAGVPDGVELLGDPSTPVLERLWARPALSILGLDAPAVALSSNTLSPAAAARVSIRLAPGQDPARATKLLADFLREQAPWGVRVEVTPGWCAGAWSEEPTGPAFEACARALEAAYGAPAVFTGVGASLPFVEAVTSALDGVPALLLGVEDPDSRAHGVDESLHLGDFRNACLGEAYLLGELAALGRASVRGEQARA
ncbi:MAG TPA: M20/M25/M40 family metallo-hydrolase [Egibacteraceae bacterium]|nr:M20/M25/M40 family metallo-hydrolase [Egibacteraceae bacterium]